MRKLLLVDDDSLILEDICNLIQWENCGFFHPFTAESGKQALDILEKEQVDFVITDISMQEMSGVELIYRVKKKFPNVLLAVLSNYDDFVYVKEAMKAGAVEYLLKYEIEPENLKVFLMQMKGRLEEERKAQKDYQKMIKMHEDARSDLAAHFFRRIYWGYEDIIQLKEQAARLGIPLRGGVWIPALADLSGKRENIKESFVQQIGISTEYIISDEGRIFGTLVKENLAFFCIYIPEVSFLLVTTLITKVLKVLKERFECSDIKAFLYSGKICMEIEEIEDSLKEMQDYEYLRFYLGNAVVQMGTGMVRKGEFPAEDWQKVLEEVDAGGPSEFEKAWKLFEKAVKTERPTEEELKENFLDGLGKRMKKGEGSWKERLQNMDTCTEVLQYTKELLWEYSKSNQMLKEISRKEIRETVQFLYRHYAEAFTLNTLADMANMSRAYFCKVFKDETGMNYTDFLNHIRIERAKQFLKKSNLNTCEIAERVGCSDYRYFCRLFKNLTGKTCGEYRKESVVHSKEEKGGKQEC